MVTDCDHLGLLHFIDPEAEIDWEPGLVSSDSLIQSLGTYAVECCQIRVQQYPLPANHKNSSGDRTVTWLVDRLGHRYRSWDNLGYAGRDPIKQTHAFCERTESARVFTALTLGDIERLLRSSKLIVYARERKHGPGFWTAEKPRFRVAPFLETLPGSGWYRGLQFRFSTPIEVELAEAVIEAMRRRRTFVEMTATDGQLRLEHCVLVEGGVTEEHLRLQLRNWRGFVAAVGDP